MATATIDGRSCTCRRMEDEDRRAGDSSQSRSVIGGEVAKSRRARDGLSESEGGKRKMEVKMIV